MPKRRRLKVAALAVIVAAAVSWWPLHAYLVRRFGVSELSTFRALMVERFGLGGEDDGGSEEPSAAAGAWVPPQPIALDPSIIPFRQIGDRLGPRAVNDSVLPVNGAAVFDANGDGRLDLYITHAGRTVAKQTTADGVLTDERVPAKPCALYLNQGNDAHGEPLFRSVEDLAAGNATLVREELLVENKYRPRNSLGDDELAPGRIAWGAVSADFNGDGRQDLYVLNAHYGLLLQTHQLGMRVYPARDNLGRSERREPLVIRQPSFLWGSLVDGMNATVTLGEKPEPEGRNTLYVNLGDRDGDGIPEWGDATDEAGVGGHFASTSAAVADFDRDGDLDLYVANLLDPDFWGFGDTRFAGEPNQLYRNLLRETGQMRFRDIADELGVAGRHEREKIASTLWVPAEKRWVLASAQTVGGRQVGERADHSWAAAFVDWNGDGWPDLVVANDIGNRLRIYQNLEGKGFRYLRALDDPRWDGCWMGMSSGDLDGDLADEIFVTNCGSQVMSARNKALLVEDDRETNVQALSILNYARGIGTLHHEVLSFAQGRIRGRGTEVRIEHSPHIPPDMSQEVNFAPDHRDLFARHRFATSLAGLEFAFNAPMFDVDNDGDLDLYLAGALLRGNDGFVGDWSGSPGRMLVNESSGGPLLFRDRTLEYRLLDVTDVDYDHNPPRRPSPGTGWHKRDFVYVTDTDAYEGMGLAASRSVVHDIFRLHEAANCLLAADLNGDGSEDLVITHAGGYNSVSPRARNLRVEIAGRTLAVPAPNKVMKPPTAFEGGATFVYLNGGPPHGSPGHWVRLRLIDPSASNPAAVGARVVANGRIARTVQATSGAAFGGANEDLHLGLGRAALHTLEIRWPSGDLQPERVEDYPPATDAVVCVERGRGVVDCIRAPPS